MLSKFPIFPLLAAWLLLSPAAGSAWAETAKPGAEPETASNIEGWVDEEDEGDPQNNWTWFGMGYESRVSGSSASVAAGSRSSGAGGAGAASPAAVMNQRGRGRR
jgi:hypothetical protein